MLASEQFIDSWNEIATSTKTVLDAYQQRLPRTVRPPQERPTNRPSKRSRTAPNGDRWRPTIPDMAATLLSPLQGRVGTDEDKEAVTTAHRSASQPHRDGIGPCRRRWAEVVGPGQAARTVDGRREEGTRPKGSSVASSSTAPFRRKRNSTKPSTSYGTHFRSTSTKAQSSFWSEPCSVPAKSLKTTSGLRTCC